MIIKSDKVSKLQKELASRLQQIKDKVAQKRTGLKTLEELSNDARKAFDEAIEAMKNMSREDIVAGVKRRRDVLIKWKISVFETIFPINWVFVASMPFIYGMIVPMIIFHICLEIYHHVCFRLYNIPIVNRKKYFIYNRKMLPYLNWLEKFHCIYCSYFNNLLLYAMEISGRTERFWCPIKYAQDLERHHSQYPMFADYFDAKKFRSERKEFRDFSDIKKQDELEKINKSKTSCSTINESCDFSQDK